MRRPPARRRPADERRPLPGLLVLAALVPATLVALSHPAAAVGGAVGATVVAAALRAPVPARPSEDAPPSSSRATADRGSRSH